MQVVEYLQVLRDNYNDDLKQQQSDLNFVNYTAGRINGLDELIDLTDFIQKYRIKEDGDKSAMVEES